MWEVDNQTRYAHSHSWDRDRDGAETWIVLIKGTFDILADGSTKPADEQLPVCTIPVYTGPPGASSLRMDSDLLRVKPTTDVLVSGHAYAPRGRSVSQVDVTLRLDTLEKTLRVFGDRIWVKGLAGPKLGSPLPFEAMPLTYERAFGGVDRRTDDPVECDWDDRNPVGVGFVTDPAHLADQLAPNVMYPDSSISDWRNRPHPAGFGPIAAHWMPRRQWGGTYDETWERRRKPLVPDNLNDRFYLCAPQDQWPARHLVGGEAVELTNMSADGVLRFRLPSVLLGFETIFDTGERMFHRQTLHTVIIEPGVRRVSMVWQSALTCHAKVLNLDRTEVVEKVRVSNRKTA